MHVTSSSGPSVKILNRRYVHPRQRISVKSDPGTIRVAAGFLLLALSLSGCFGPIGEQFNDIDQITLSKSWQDWVVVGRFGPQGPFKLTDVKYCDYNEPCSFTHNGQGHSYEQFTNFKLAVLRLESRQGEVSHVVLRSKLNLFGDTR